MLRKELNKQAQIETAGNCLWLYISRYWSLNRFGRHTYSRAPVLTTKYREKKNAYIWRTECTISTHNFITISLLWCVLPTP